MSTITGTIDHSVFFYYDTSGTYTSPLTITATGSVSSNGNIDAVYGGRASAETSMEVYNQGQISNSDGFGINLYSGGTIINGASGVIAATGGVLVGFGQGTTPVTVINRGLIDGGGVFIRPDESRADTVVNYGTIAVGGNTYGVFLGGGSDLLVLEPGSQLGGEIGHFQKGDTIDLVGTVANAASFANGSLTLYDGGAKVGTVQLGGTLTTGQFHLATDGHNGTDITIGPGQVVGGTLAGTLYHSVTLTSSGTYASPFTVSSIGAIIPSGTTGAVYGPSSGAAVLSNAGTIAGGIGTAGISSRYGAGPGGAGGAGISFSGAGTIGNTGVIAGGAGGAGGGGKYYDGMGGAGGSGIILAGGGSIGNTGTIRGGAGGASSPGRVGSPGNAIVLTAGGTLNNGFGGSVTGSVGVEAYGAATIANRGLISSVAFQGSAASTVVNYGTLGAAVAFGPGADLLLIEPGSTFSGISGFHHGATIDLVGTVANGASYAGGTLTLLSGAQTLTSFAVLGTSYPLVSGDFALKSDGSGGTDITDTHGVPITGTIDHSITISTTGAYASPLTIASTGAVSNSGAGDAIYGPSSSGWTVANNGTVTASGNYDGIDLKAGGTVSNASGALIRTALGGTRANGIAIYGGAGSVSNAGTIVSGYGSGVTLAGGGTVRNSGTISGGNASAAVAASGSTQVYNYTSDLIAGGTGSNGGTGGSGIVLAGGGRLVNQGTVSGGSGGSGGVGGSGVMLSSGGSVLNTGEIAAAAGGIAIQGSAATITNYGTIAASSASGTAISLTGTASVLQLASQSAIVGHVAGGGGTLELLQGGHTISGLGTAYTGFGTIAGGDLTLAGANTIASGTTLSLSAGLYEFVTGSLTNFGVIDVGAGGKVKTAGGTLTLEGGSQLIGTLGGSGGTLALDSQAGAGTLSGLGFIYGSFAQYAVVAGANWTMTGGNRIAGGATLTNAGTLTVGGTLTDSGSGLSNTGTLNVGGILTDTGNTLSNTGRIAVTSGGTLALGGGATGNGTIALSGGGDFLQIGANGAAGALSNAITGFAPGDTFDLVGIGLASSYSYSGGTLTLMNSGGTIDQVRLSTVSGHLSFTLANDFNGGTKLGLAAQSGTSTITGTINHGVTLSSGGTYLSPLTVTSTGAVLDAGAGDAVNGPAGSAWTVSNAGTVSAASGRGVYLGGSGSLANTGLIENSAAGSAAVSFLNAAAALTNSGTVSSGSNVGVYLDAGGVVTNAAGGKIAGTYGVYLAGPAAATIANSGIITGAIGIEIAGADTAANTIVNSGTITGTGGTAIQLAGNSATLVIEQNSVLTGAVAGFASGDTIDFAGQSGTSVSFSYGVLSLMAGGAPIASVDLSGLYAAGEFAVASDGSGGTDVTFSADPTQAQLTTTSDFTGDGMSDVLWQNDNAQDSGSGQTAIWLMDGVNPTAEDIITTVPTSWHVVATGDFYGTGDAAILWQNDDGQAGLWEMNGTNPTAETVFASPPPSWHMIATGDFNGDGMSDVLWQYEDTGNSPDSQNGNVAIWEMNGASAIAAAVVAQPGPDWNVIGTGDFNGDGKSDILWQYEDSQNASDPQNGNVAIWEMNGLTPITEAVIAQPGPDWHVVGTGDFNGDGKADILWQYEDGQNASDPQNGNVAIWLMNGTTPTASAVVAQPGSAWHAIGTGDYDGSGRSDILWQNTDGQAAIWLMNGLTPTTESVFAAPPSSWHVIPS